MYFRLYEKIIMFAALPWLLWAPGGAQLLNTHTYLFTWLYMCPRFVAMHDIWIEPVYWHDQFYSTFEDETNEKKNKSSV